MPRKCCRTWRLPGARRLEESEDGEGDMEVMEYLRVAPLLLFTETKKSAEPAAPKPSLH